MAQYDDEGFEVNLAANQQQLNPLNMTEMGAFSSSSISYPLQSSSPNSLEASFIQDTSLGSSTYFERPSQNHTENHATAMVPPGTPPFGQHRGSGSGTAFPQLLLQEPAVNNSGDMGFCQNQLSSYGSNAQNYGLEIPPMPMSGLYGSIGLISMNNLFDSMPASAGMTMYPNNLLGDASNRAREQGHVASYNSQFVPPSSAQFPMIAPGNASFGASSGNGQQSNLTWRPPTSAWARRAPTRGPKVKAARSIANLIPPAFRGPQTLSDSSNKRACPSKSQPKPKKKAVTARSGETPQSLPKTVIDLTEADDIGNRIEQTPCWTSNRPKTSPCLTKKVSAPVVHFAEPMQSIESDHLGLLSSDFEARLSHVTSPSITPNDFLQTLAANSLTVLDAANAITEEVNESTSIDLNDEQFSQLLQGQIELLTSQQAFIEAQSPFPANAQQGSQSHSSASMPVFVNTTGFADQANGGGHLTASGETSHKITSEVEPQADLANITRTTSTTVDTNHNITTVLDLHEITRDINIPNAMISSTSATIPSPQVSRTMPATITRVTVPVTTPSRKKISPPTNVFIPDIPGYPPVQRASLFNPHVSQASTRVTKPSPKISQKNSRARQPSFQAESSTPANTIDLTGDDIQQLGVSHSRGLAVTMREMRFNQTRAALAASFEQGEISMVAAPARPPFFTDTDTNNHGSAYNAPANPIRQNEHRMTRHPRVPLNNARGTSVSTPMAPGSDLVAIHQRYRRATSNVLRGSDVAWSLPILPQAQSPAEFLASDPIPIGSGAPLVETSSSPSLGGSPRSVAYIADDCEELHIFDNENDNDYNNHDIDDLPELDSDSTRPSTSSSNTLDWSPRPYSGKTLPATWS